MGLNRKEVFGNWLKALRSGEYEQGFGRLRSEDDEYCVLGVLCDVANPQGWVQLEEKWFYTTGDKIHTTTFAFEKMGLRYPSVEGYLVASYPEMVAPNSSRVSLVSLNDTSKLPFSAMADIVEKSPYWNEWANG